MCWCLPCGCCLAVRLANDTSELTSLASAADGYNTLRLALFPLSTLPLKIDGIHLFSFFFFLPETLKSFAHSILFFCQRFSVFCYVIKLWTALLLTEQLNFFKFKLEVRKFHVSKWNNIELCSRCSHFRMHLKVKLRYK